MRKIIRVKRSALQKKDSKGADCEESDYKIEVVGSGCSERTFEVCQEKLNIR